MSLHDFFERTRERPRSDCGKRRKTIEESVKGEKGLCEDRWIGGSERKRRTSL